MALTLDQIRTYTRTHLDIDDEDLPDTVLDLFIREGSKRIERAAPRWPFYERSWTFATLAGTRSYSVATISTEIDQLAAIHGSDWEMQWVGHDLMERLNPSGSTTQSKPIQYSTWADTVYLSPTPDDAYTLTVRGYRKPTDWVAQGGGAVPDLPDDLHNTVALWAVAKAYEQQEDPDLAQVYERQFLDELEVIRKRIVEVPHPQPLVLNAQSSLPHTVFGRLRFPFEV